GIGDVCDTCTDIDGDTVGDAGFTTAGCATPGFDNCTFKPNLMQTDTDLDGMGNACDTCPAGDNTADEDNDGIADACDFCLGDATNSCTATLIDTDGDGIPDDWDNCPADPNPIQADFDSDGI